MGLYNPSFGLRAALVMSVLIVKSVAGTLTLNAKSRTALFTCIAPNTTHVSHSIPSAFPFVHGKEGSQDTDSLMIKIPSKFVIWSTSDIIKTLQS